MRKHCGNCANHRKETNQFSEECGKCVSARLENGETTDPSHWKAKPQTNADRIRAMSDEELAKFLGEYQFADMCDEGCENCTYHGDCDKRILEWLKQPTKENDDERN